MVSELDVEDVITGSCSMGSPIGITVAESGVSALRVVKGGGEDVIALAQRK
jgi:hypothetical protein